MFENSTSLSVVQEHIDLWEAFFKKLPGAKDAINLSILDELKTIKEEIIDRNFRAASPRF